ncbi:MAG TPA: response regulator transcription factor [Pirellulales bacterium]|jgi:two-component system OmpR family response regulator|nr:response regulator transcription factor [Pirellulales bacterium]
MKHILIVEDETHLAIGIKYNLEAEGYLVTTMSDGPSALKFLSENPTTVDLIILDLMLPGMSGYDVCDTLRQQGSDVPILMLSARTLTEDRIHGFDVGTDVYLHKPFDLEELLSVSRNLLSRRRRALIAEANSEQQQQPTIDAGIVYRFADGRAVVNFDTYQVEIDGRSAKLTALEMKLLRYFVEHEGSVVTRSELLENVWGMSHSPTTRTVDNFIVNLRKYFEQDPAQPRYFLSVRGAGYRFVGNCPNNR